MSCFQSKLTVKSKPRLNWDVSCNYGVSGSGWNPFAGLRVSVIDESLSKDEIAIYVEPPAPGASMFCFLTITPMIVLLPVMYPIAVSNSSAAAYVFSLNVATGKIDLFNRIKPFRGEEIRTVYEDVTYFGVKFKRDESFENLYTSSFVLTFKDGEIRIPNGESFALSHHLELEAILNAVNGLIARSLERRDDLNCSIYPLLRTGCAEEFIAIPHAFSELLEAQSSEFADCTTANVIRNETLTSQSSSETESIANTSGNETIRISNHPILSGEEGPDAEAIQEAILIPDADIMFSYRREVPNSLYVPFY